VQDIRASELGDQSTDLLVTDTFSLDVNSILVFTKLNPQVLARVAIRACKVFAIQLNILLNGVLDWAIWRLD
jgi:hypothetical protein